MGGSGKNPRYAVAISRELKLEREWKEVSRKYVCDDDIAVAERFRFRAKQPIGDDGHRNGHLLRDADSPAAAAAEEVAGNAVDTEGRGQSDHQRRHLWRYQWD